MDACSVLLELFIKKTIPFPLNCIATIVKKLTINVQAYLWTLNSVLLIYASTLMSVPQCVNDRSFVVSFKIKKYESARPPIALFIFQDYFTLAFPYQFKDKLVIFCKKGS